MKNDTRRIPHRYSAFIFEANQAGLDIGDIYHVLDGQKIIAETILKLSIESAYKERFGL